MQIGFVCYLKKHKPFKRTWNNSMHLFVNTSEHSTENTSHFFPWVIFIHLWLPIFKANRYCQRTSMNLTVINHEKGKSIYNIFAHPKNRLFHGDIQVIFLLLQVVPLKLLLFKHFSLTSRFDYEFIFCIVKLIQPFLIPNWFALHHD